MQYRYLTLRLWRDDIRSPWGMGMDYGNLEPEDVPDLLDLKMPNMADATEIEILNQLGRMGWKIVQARRDDDLRKDYLLVQERNAARLRPSLLPTVTQELAARERIKRENEAALAAAQ